MRANRIHAKLGSRFISRTSQKGQASLIHSTESSNHEWRYFSEFSNVNYAEFTFKFRLTEALAHERTVNAGRRRERIQHATKNVEQGDKRVEKNRAPTLEPKRREKTGDIASGERNRHERKMEREEWTREWRDGKKRRQSGNRCAISLVEGCVRAGAPSNPTAISETLSRPSHGAMRGNGFLPRTVDGKLRQRIFSLHTESPKWE
jgi:hypothetical protein